MQLHHCAHRAILGSLAALLLIPVPALGQLPVGASPIAAIRRSMSDHTPVTIQGRVIRQVKMDEFIVSDNTGQILIDVERGSDFGVAVGQTIWVQGEVDTSPFSATKVNANSIRLINNPSLPTGNVSERGDLVFIRSAYLNAADGDIVTVHGRIVRRLDQREFIIRDETGDIIVDADFESFSNVPLTVGQDIIVNGEVDIYWGGPWREIEAHNIQVPQTPPPPRTPPVLEVIPIADVHSTGRDTEIVTIKGSVARQIDLDDYLFQDDTGSIVVDADPKLFSHFALREGLTYTVTGRLDRDEDNRFEVVALLITELPLETRPVQSADDLPPEIPISSVYYDMEGHEIVTVAGSVIRRVDRDDFVLQDDTGVIVVSLEAGKFENLQLGVGKFLVVMGEVQGSRGAITGINARRVLIRARPGE